MSLELFQAAGKFRLEAGFQLLIKCFDFIVRIYILRLSLMVNYCKVLTPYIDLKKQFNEMSDGLVNPPSK